jgi:hypothetical protein
LCDLSSLLYIILYYIALYIIYYVGILLYYIALYIILYYIILLLFTFRYFPLSLLLILSDSFLQPFNLQHSMGSLTPWQNLSIIRYGILRSFTLLTYKVYTGSIPEVSLCDRQTSLNSSHRLSCIRQRRGTCHNPSEQQTGRR